MKILGGFVGLAAVVALAGSVAAQTVVVGTGDPAVDVPAVQAAVDQGGQIVLKGRFSFNRPALPWKALLNRTVLVSKAVAISGVLDDQGQMTAIEGGDNPFAIEAPGAAVSIRGLRFVRPIETAISAFAVSGLVIASCRIEGVEPLPSPATPTGTPLGVGITIDTTLDSPTPDRPAQPQNISGSLLILNNDIDVGTKVGTNTLGILIFDAGTSPDNEVNIYISANNIRNITERAINMRRPGGRVYIERNAITTGATMGAGGGVGPLVDGIHIVGPGSYLIAHNTIDSAWANGAAIRLQGQPDPFAPSNDSGVIERAIVVDNDVTMSAPEGTVFGANSAGIEIRQFAQSNVVVNNRIRGRARAALSVAIQGMGIPDASAFVLNDLADFQSSLADIFVGAGITNTLVVGRKGTVEDHGIGTVVVPMP
jgi:hypothetical protein